MGAIAPGLPEIRGGGAIGDKKFVNGVLKKKNNNNKRPLRFQNLIKLSMKSLDGY